MSLCSTGQSDPHGGLAKALQTCQQQRHRLQHRGRPPVDHQLAQKELHQHELERRVEELSQQLHWMEQQLMDSSSTELQLIDQLRQAEARERALHQRRTTSPSQNGQTLYKTGPSRAGSPGGLEQQLAEARWEQLSLQSRLAELEEQLQLTLSRALSAELDAQQPTVELDRDGLVARLERRVAELEAELAAPGPSNVVWQGPDLSPHRLAQGREPAQDERLRGKIEALAGKEEQLSQLVVDLDDERSEAKAAIAELERACEAKSGEILELERRLREAEDQEAAAERRREMERAESKVQAEKLRETVERCSQLAAVEVDADSKLRRQLEETQSEAQAKGQAVREVRLNAGLANLKLVLKSWTQGEAGAAVHLWSVRVWGHKHTNLENVRRIREAKLREWHDAVEDWHTNKEEKLVLQLQAKIEQRFAAGLANLKLVVKSWTQGEAGSAVHSWSGRVWGEKHDRLEAAVLLGEQTCEKGIADMEQTWSAVLAEERADKVLAQEAAKGDAALLKARTRESEIKLGLAAVMSVLMQFGHGLTVACVHRWRMNANTAMLNASFKAKSIFAKSIGKNSRSRQSGPSRQELEAMVRDLQQQIAELDKQRVDAEGIASKKESGLRFHKALASAEHTLLDEQADEVKELRSKVADLDTALEAKAAENDDLNADLEAKTAQNADLIAALEAKAAENASLREKLVTDSESDERDGKIATLQLANQENLEAIEKLSALLDENKIAIDKLEGQLAEKDSELDGEVSSRINQRFTSGLANLKLVLKSWTQGEAGAAVHLWSVRVWGHKHTNLENVRRIREAKLREWHDAVEDWHTNKEEQTRQLMQDERAESQATIAKLRADLQESVQENAKLREEVAQQLVSSGLLPRPELDAILSSDLVVKHEPESGTQLVARTGRVGVVKKPADDKPATEPAQKAPDVAAQSPDPISVQFLNKTGSASVWFKLRFEGSSDSVEGLVPEHGLKLTMPPKATSISWREWDESKPGEEADFSSKAQSADFTAEEGWEFTFDQAGISRVDKQPMADVLLRKQVASNVWYRVKYDTGQMVEDVLVSESLQLTLPAGSTEILWLEWPGDKTGAEAEFDPSKAVRCPLHAVRV